MTSTPLAILAIGDTSFRERMRNTLTGLRWRVLEACGGAEALAQLGSGDSAAVIMDAWFPDLEVQEFVREVESTFPEVDLISTDGSFERTAKVRNSRHGELLYALRVNQEGDGPAAGALRGESNVKSAHAAVGIPSHTGGFGGRSFAYESGKQSISVAALRPEVNFETTLSKKDDFRKADAVPCKGTLRTEFPEFAGSHALLLDMYRRIRLVAQRQTPVLIQGPSGTGKELVARSLHRLSRRAQRPFVTLNCAAIPESLLEAELFGHTKGAFTGAVQGRVGRIEAAAGGTLFLDEIGEMPILLQAKLLRFLEAGELQKVGDNQTFHVDARVISATNQNLGMLTAKGMFRADLFYRLAVFMIETPALLSHLEDLAELIELFLTRLAVDGKQKKLTSGAFDKLSRHSWPGNVRELSHVLERAHILAEHHEEIDVAEIEFAYIPSMA